MSRPANFCPKCGGTLHMQERSGRERPVCTVCDFTLYFDPKVAVLAVVIENEQVLLIKRAIDPGQGKWACPAGFVDHDEAPEDAVLRELREETNLIGKVERLLAVFPKKDDGLADIVIAYQVSVIGGILSPADDASAAQWFGRDNIPELVFYPTVTLIKQRWRNGHL